MVIRRSKTLVLKEVIDQFLDKYNLNEGLNEQELIRRWYDVTGKMVSNSTESIYIKNRKLIVKISSAVVRNELTMIKDGLIKELNSPYEKTLIDDILFR